MVGVRGFEPPTPSSRTSLRYTPTNWCWRAYTVMTTFPQVFFIKKPVNNCRNLIPARHLWLSIAVYGCLFVVCGCVWASGAVS